VRLRFVSIALVAAGMIAALALQANQVGEAGTCPNDSKLLNGGPTSVFGEGPDTWWGLIIDGLTAAGFDEEAEQVAYLNRVFSTSFTTLDELKAFNLQLVSDVWDKNKNGYVCAYELRGTRQHYDDPFINLTFFGVSDDKIKK